MQVNDNLCIDIEKLISVALIVRLALVVARLRPFFSVNLTLLTDQ